MHFTFFDLLSFANGFLLLFLALMQLAYRRKAPVNYLAILIYFLMAYISLYFWSFQTHALDRLPWLINSDLIASCLLAPALYLYFGAVSGLLEPSFRRHAWLFLPAIVTLWVLISIRLAGIHPVLPPLRTSGPVVIQALGVLMDLWIGAVLFRLVYKIRRLFTGNRLRVKPELRILLMFLVVGAANAAWMIAAHVWRQDAWLNYSTHGFGFLLTVYTFYAFRYPEFAQAVIKDVKSLRYENTSLNRIDTRDLSARLERAMQDEKAYRDMDLTLAGLSARLNVTPHQLSEFLNQSFGQNFRKFLNSQRVQEAKHLLTEEPCMSILDIAFAAGFNSKSSFNTFFLQSTGLTPSAYRKRWFSKL